MSSALRPPVSASSPPVRSWPVESSNPTAGADAVAVKEPRAARLSAGWPTSRWGGVRRRWRSRSAATGAPAAATCGAKTRLWRPSHARSSPGEGWRGLAWALEGIVIAHLTVARVAEGLGVAWNTANDAVLAQGTRVLIEDPNRFDGVRVLGVDEHVWRLQASLQGVARRSPSGMA